MKTTIIKYKELPFEIDKVYETKIKMFGKVTLKRIDTDKKGNIIGFGVIIEKYEHLGICPLGPDRLIADKIEDGEISVCSNCGEPISDVINNLTLEDITQIVGAFSDMNITEKMVREYMDLNLL